MRNWERTEVDTAEWVQRNVPEKWVVKHYGGSNSKKPDLQLTHKVDKEVKNLEIKLLPSRCGQFALKQDGEMWKFSERNQVKESFMSKKIIQYVNQEKAMDQIEHSVPKTIVYHWVKDYLEQKNVEAIIASTPSQTKKYVIKKSELENYLDIKLVVRRKKSGSRAIPKKERLTAQEQILEKYPEAIFKEKQKYLIVSNIKPDNQYINEYILSPVNEGFSVRKPSKTSSVTVEFVITLKENIHIQKHPEKLLKSLFTYEHTIPNSLVVDSPLIKVRRKIERREDRKTISLKNKGYKSLYYRRSVS